MRGTEPEHFRRGGSGSGASAILSAALLMLLGALLTVVAGVVTGILPPAKLVALFTGSDVTVASTPRATPAVEVAASVPAADPAPVPASVPTPDPAPVTASLEPQNVRVLRDETFGDWRFICIEAKPGAAPSCSASQQLKVAETGAPVFVWRIVQDGRGGLVGLWQVPETVLVDAGLTLDAGTPEPIGMPFEGCGEGSCRAIANLTPDFLEKLSSTKTLSASVVLTNRQPLKFPLSPTGLDRALAALAQ